MKKINKVLKAIKKSVSVNYNVTPGFGGYGKKTNTDKFVHYML